MNNLNRILTACCLGLVGLSFAACDPVKEVTAVEASERNMTPAQQGISEEGVTQEYH